MKFWGRKGFSFLIFLIMFLAAASCGAQDSLDSAAGVEESRNTAAGYPGERGGGQERMDGEESHPVAVADFHYMETEEQLLWENLMMLNGDWLYYVDTVLEDEEGEEFERTHWGVFRRDISGEGEPELFLKSGKILALCKLCTLFADGEGNCYTFWSEDAESELDNPDREPAGYFMEKYDRNGALLWHMDYTLEELDGAGERLNQGTAAEDGRIFLYHAGPGESILAFGEDGNLDKAYTPGLEAVDGIAAGKGGQVYAYCTAGEDTVFTALGETEGTYVCPMKPLQVYSGWKEGIYLCNRDGLWVYAPETGETEFLWGWEDEYIQMDVNSVRQITPGTGTVNLWCREQFTNSNGAFSLMRRKDVLTFVAVAVEDSRDYPGKQVVTMELSEYDEQFPDHTGYLVRRYNRQSRQYKVEIIYHEGIYEEELEKQLMQGNGPDLVGLREMDVVDLAARGAFEELTDYYAGSSLVSWDDVLEPVQEACRVVGKNILVIPAFHIKNLVALRTEEMEKASEDWTPLRFLELAGGRRMFRDQSPQEAFGYCMGIASGEHFIDYEEKESRFDCGEFRQILEGCSRWDKVQFQSAGGFSDMQLAYAENWDWLLEERDYYELQDFMVGDEAVMMVGYPGWDGAECRLVSEEVYAVNSASENKEGAWDFLEFVLSEEMQEEVDWAFPSRKETFEKGLTDPYVNPMYMDVHQPGKEDLDEVRKWVNCAVYNHRPGWNTLWNILSEEAGMYFEGDATLDATVDKIQNRVQLYLDEL